jgi:hypothetical protein
MQASLKMKPYPLANLASLAFAFVCLFAGTPTVCSAASPKPVLPGELKLERIPSPASLSATALLGPPSLGECPIIVKLHLEDGEELPLALDTGLAVTILDESLVPKLGPRIGTTNSSAPFAESATLGIYSAPRLYAGHTPLLTGPQVYTAKPLPDRPQKGTLGMDFLRHYCIQFDFVAGTMRFLDPEHLDRAELGKPFPLKPGWGGITYFEGDLFAQGKMRFLLDTGWACPYDGMVDTNVFAQLQKKYPTHGGDFFLTIGGSTASGSTFARLGFSGQTYTDVRLVMGGVSGMNINGVIGMRLLARHKVTLNFPKQKLYLNYIAGGPLMEIPGLSPNPVLAANTPWARASGSLNVPGDYPILNYEFQGDAGQRPLFVVFWKGVGEQTSRNDIENRLQSINGHQLNVSFVKRAVYALRTDYSLQDLALSDSDVSSVLNAFGKGTPFDVDLWTNKLSARISTLER